MSEEPAPIQVLVADDEANFRRVLRLEMTRSGLVVSEVGRGDEALERLRSGAPIDVVVLDLRMPGLDGMDVLRQARRAGSRAEVIVLTGHGSIDSVVEAMKLGAFDYLTKPCRLSELELPIRRAAARRRSALGDGAGLAAPPAPGAAPDGGAGTEVVFGGSAMARVIQVIDRAAPTDASVLIEGESGSGKELLARRVHARSKVAAGPLVVINCGAIAESLILTDLFGHEKGAFTGADRQKPGLLETANGGTAFLDEVGELPAEAQVRLLRFLQFGELRRVGGTDLLKVKVRIVAATNRRLADEVREGRFREDLFYRLHTIHVTVPPLRERPGETSHLAAHFLARSASGAGKSLAPDALALLERYPWPGNVRELENIVERLAILCDGPTIRADDVRAHLDGLELPVEATSPPAPAEDGSAAPNGAGASTLRDLERAGIVAALARSGGNRARAAEALGVSIRTLYYKIKALGIEG